MVKDIVSSIRSDLNGSLLKAVDVAPKKRVKVAEAKVSKPKAKPKLFKLKKVKVVFK